MCEIAILDPERSTEEHIASAAHTVYENMRDSLGIVSVQDKGDKFEYDVFIATDPEYVDIIDFVKENFDETERYIIHGRLGTTGRVSVQNAHPIEVDCDECSIDYVLHNGVIRGHENLRDTHEHNGHDYTTVVDSEVIAHHHQDVPETFDDGSQSIFGREPAYILLSEDRIYAYSTRRYTMTEDFRMAISSRSYGPGRSNTNHVELISTPSEV